MLNTVYYTILNKMGLSRHNDITTLLCDLQEYFFLRIFDQSTD